jgi:hypothetical protein
MKTNILIIIIFGILTACSGYDPVPHVKPCEPFSEEFVEALEVPRIHRYVSPDAFTVAERVHCLDAPDRADFEAARVAYSVKLDRVDKGDLLHIDTMIHAENPMEVSVLFVVVLVVADSPDEIHGEELIERVGDNISAADHYADKHVGLTIRAEEKIRGKYLNVVVYSATDAKVFNKHTRVISSGGFLNVVLERR